MLERERFVQWTDIDPNVNLDLEIYVEKMITNNMRKYSEILLEMDTLYEFHEKIVQFDMIKT